MPPKSQQSSEKSWASQLFRGRSTGPTIPLPPPLDGSSENGDNGDDAIVPDPSDLELPPRPPSAGELPAPLDFLTPSKFHGNFVTEDNRIAEFPAERIAEDALSTRVILHPRMPALLDAFLKYKRVYGSTHERALYPTMTWPQLATRLIAKRPLCFLQCRDLTRLRDDTWIGSAWREWDRVGTEVQHLNKHLTLAEYLSYDEIMLSSLVGASGPTHFINSGSRFNCGERDYRGIAHEDRGIIVGLAGPRFDRDAQHDSAIIVKPPPPGASVSGARMDPVVRRMLRAWLVPGRDAVGATTSPAALFDPKTGFDVPVYKARCRVAFDVLLLEAEARARAAGKEAWVHVVGLGLGVWRKHVVQNRWYVEAFAESLRELDLQHVDTVELGWIGDVTKATREAVVEAGRSKAIEVRFTEKDPCRKLEREGLLLVVSWAWDGNSYVGNEYWNGYMDSSSDPAAVCFSTIGELMNPDINPFAERVWVLGARKEEEEKKETAEDDDGLYA